MSPWHLLHTSPGGVPRCRLLLGCPRCPPSLQGEGTAAFPQHRGWRRGWHHGAAALRVAAGIRGGIQVTAPTSGTGKVPLPQDRRAHGWSGRPSPRVLQHRSGQDDAPAAAWTCPDPRLAMPSRALPRWGCWGQGGRAAASCTPARGHPGRWHVPAPGRAPTTLPPASVGAAGGRKRWGRQNSHKSPC